jgi:hypothetical protein
MLLIMIFVVLPSKQTRETQGHDIIRLTALSKQYDLKDAKTRET